MPARLSNTSAMWPPSVENGHTQNFVFEPGGLTAHETDCGHDRDLQNGDSAYFAVYRVDLTEVFSTRRYGAEILTLPGPSISNAMMPLARLNSGSAVDEDRHDAPVDDVGERVAIRDDLDLVPLAGLDRGFQIVGGCQGWQAEWAFCPARSRRPGCARR